MIYRVHRDAANLRATTEPARASGFPKRDVAMLDVAYLANGRVALDVDATYFTAGQSKLRPIAFLRDKLSSAARGSNHLPAFARARLYVVNSRAERDEPERQSVPRDNVSFRPRNNSLPDL